MNRSFISVIMGGFGAAKRGRRRHRRQDGALGIGEDAAFLLANADRS